MSTIINRTITFEDEGIIRRGIVQECSFRGTLLVNVIDKIDDLKQIILPPEQAIQIERGGEFTINQIN